MTGLLRMLSEKTTDAVISKKVNSSVFRGFIHLKHPNSLSVMTPDDPYSLIFEGFRYLKHPSKNLTNFLTNDC